MTLPEIQLVSLSAMAATARAMSSVRVSRPPGLSRAGRLSTNVVMAM